MEAILSLSSVHKIFNDKVVIDDVSIELNAFENLAIIGETGSSKTTLLKTMSGLLEVDRGEVAFRGEKVKGPSSRLVPVSEVVMPSAWPSDPGPASSVLSTRCLPRRSSIVSRPVKSTPARTRIACGVSAPAVTTLNMWWMP